MTDWPPKQTTDLPPLGRLASLGLTKPHEAALIMPEGYRDYRYPFSSYSASQPGTEVFVQGVIAYEPRFGFTRSGKPRTEVTLRGTDSSELVVQLFGVDKDRDALLSQLYAQSQIVFFQGDHIAPLGKQLWLKKAQRVPSPYAGRVVPEYAGKRGVVKPETIQAHLMTYVKACLPGAARQLLEQALPARSLADPDSDVDAVSLGILRALIPPQASTGATPKWGVVDEWVRNQLQTVHLPRTPGAGERAREVIARLGALGVLNLAQAQQARRGISLFSCPSSWKGRATDLPFSLSTSQIKAIEQAQYDLHQPLVMRRVLVGDVGSGKTAVYAITAASVVDGGGSVAILLPSDALAKQVFREILAWWPDLQSVTERVGPKRKGRDIPGGARLLIGTTALLHQLGDRELSFCVIDEQHKFSVGQREQLLANGTHLLEVTATPIPRTQALIEYGSTPVSRLDAHTGKNIVTRLFRKNDRAAVFQGVRESLERDERVLVVYPLKEETTSEAQVCTGDLQSVEEGLVRWRKALPDVAIDCVHAGMRDAEKDAAMKRFRNGEVQVLLSTSIVETGLNIRNLMRVIVVNAERHGLTALHQIRGRVARYGGTGYCDLLPSEVVGQPSLNRLQVLVETTDGYEVARRDMQLRGAGDLQKEASAQSGATPSVIYGNTVHMKYLEEMHDAQVAASK